MVQYDQIKPTTLNEKIPMMSEISIFTHARTNKYENGIFQQSENAGPPLRHKLLDQFHHWNYKLNNPLNGICRKI